MRPMAAFLALLISSAVGAEVDWGAWRTARTLSEAGDYEKALAELQKAPQESASYFHNLGTLALKAGRAGQALGYLEKANRLQRHDPGIQKNLAAAREVTARALGEERLDSASGWLERVADQIPLAEVRGVLGLMALILSGFWLRVYRRTRDLRATLSHPGGALGLSGLAIVICLYAAERYASARPPAIAMEAQEIRTGPSMQFSRIGSTEPGVKLRVVGSARSEGDASTLWLQVQFGADALGWLPASSLLLLQ